MNDKDGLWARDKQRVHGESTRIQKVKRCQQGGVSSGVVVVLYVPSSVARGRVMRESGMILIILSPTVQLVTKLKPNLLG